ncbi:MAG: RnfABCDGE type electron transport complex subunit B [Clostridia bacterium]|nr:RnfABCDGE type electron transport complex subunit B [Clostridia bacterium]
MNEILIALLVVAAIGLIAGVLLTLASHFLRVEEDQRAAELRACLPGVNCGACGYAGCDDYAKALAEGGVKANLCIPGADEVAVQVAAILGIAAEDVAEQVAVVHCNGTCDATSKKAIYDGVYSCRAASMLYGGPDACTYGCLGCGDCADVCPVDAICLKDGIARIDRRICIGCGMCVKTCPKEIISLVPQAATTAVVCSNKEKGAVARKVCTNACIACKKCEKNCPEGAIKVVNDLAVIDYAKCTGCGVCVEGCPTHCLVTL